MKKVTIYCEGKMGSHDFDILQKIVADFTNVLVQPIGGKRGAKSAVQVYEQLIHQSEFKMLFRDRDFDAPVPAQVELTNLESYIYLTYKPTIENYLLDFDTFFEFVDTRYGDREVVKARFIEAAKSIQHHQAVRHTLGKMRVPTDFGSNICDNSGTLPENLDRAYCRAQALDRISESKKRTDAWTEARFDEILKEFEVIFNEDFFNNLDFLNWFQGKDLAKALSIKFADLSTKKLYKFAKKHFDYTKYPDLVQLKRLIEGAENSE